MIETYLYHSRQTWMQMNFLQGSHIPSVSAAPLSLFSPPSPSWNSMPSCANLVSVFEPWKGVSIWTLKEVWMQPVHCHQRWGSRWWTCKNSRQQEQTDNWSRRALSWEPALRSPARCSSRDPPPEKFKIQKSRSSAITAPPTATLPFSRAVTAWRNACCIYFC